MPGMDGLPHRIKKSREALRLSKAEVARRVGVKSRQAATLWENGTAEPTAENLRKLSVILNVDYDWLATGRKAKPGVVLGLELHGEAAGGVWMEIPENQDREFPRVPVAPDPAYPADCQYALRVRGNSVNQIVPDGGIIVCVDIMGAGIDARDGDLVVVERRRGSTVETTVKRLKRGTNGSELWPVSSDPDHQEKLTVGRAKGVEVAMKAVVIWTANRVPRGS